MTGAIGMSWNVPVTIGTAQVWLALILDIDDLESDSWLCRSMCALGQYLGSLSLSFLFHKTGALRSVSSA